MLLPWLLTDTEIRVKAFEFVPRGVGGSVRIWRGVCLASSCCSWAGSMCSRLAVDCDTCWVRRERTCSSKS